MPHDNKNLYCVRIIYFIAGWVIVLQHNNIRGSPISLCMWVYKCNSYVCYSVKLNCWVSVLCSLFKCNVSRLSFRKKVVPSEGRSGWNEFPQDEIVPLFTSYCTAQWGKDRTNIFFKGLHLPRTYFLEIHLNILILTSSDFMFFLLFPVGVLSWFMNFCGPS